jgi:threonyl-tRNA synthetase
MIHKALLGSIERFLSVYIEHTAGNFPVWLAPVQVAILPVSEKHVDKAREVMDQLGAEGLRAELNDDNKTLGAKIRTATLQKVPYMVIIGDKEASRDGLVVTVRTRDGKDEGLQPVTDFVKTLKSSIET